MQKQPANNQKLSQIQSSDAKQELSQQLIAILKNLKKQSAQCMNQISPHQIYQMNAFARPPPIVVPTLTQVYILYTKQSILNHIKQKYSTAQSRDNGQNMWGQDEVLIFKQFKRTCVSQTPSFLEKLKRFDTNQINPKQIQEINQIQRKCQEKYNSKEQYQKKLHASSRVISYFYKWMQNILKIVEIENKIK